MAQLPHGDDPTEVWGGAVCLAILTPSASPREAATALAHYAPPGPVVVFAHGGEKGWVRKGALSFDSPDAAASMAADVAATQEHGRVTIHVGSHGTDVWHSLAYAVLERGPRVILCPMVGAVEGTWLGITKYSTTIEERVVDFCMERKFDVAVVIPASPWKTLAGAEQHLVPMTNFSSECERSNLTGRSSSTLHNAPMTYIVCLSPANTANTMLSWPPTMRYVESYAADGDRVVIVSAFGAYIIDETLEGAIGTREQSCDVRSVLGYTTQWLEGNARRLQRSRPSLVVTTEASGEVYAVNAIRAVAEREMSTHNISIVIGYGVPPMTPQWLSSTMAFVRRSTRNTILSTFAGKFAIVVA